MDILKGATRLIVTLIFITAAHAAALPTDTVVQNINGVQQCIKTYTVSPDYPSEKLAEASFERDGYSYTFSSISKKENFFEDEKPHTETVSVKTSSKELSDVLSALPPTKTYDDGKYRGVLNLNASTVHTEAAGVETQSYTVSATKEFENLDSNDMSYIPASITKDGVTLSLQSVDWQVQESELVEDMLIPSAYKAVASYAGTGYRKTAADYISTASYTGTVSCRLLKDVTYTVTYVGIPVAVEQPPKEAEEISELSESAKASNIPDDAGETTDEPNISQTSDSGKTDNETSTEKTEISDAQQIDKSDEAVSNRSSRLLYAGGGVVALIVIITVATVLERRRKRRASAYDYSDDFPYYGGYDEPPYDNPPAGSEDETALYDESAPWEEDGVSYPTDGTQYDTDETENGVSNPEGLDEESENGQKDVSNL